MLQLNEKLLNRNKLLFHNPNKDVRGQDLSTETAFRILFTQYCALDDIYTQENFG